ncbi:MAG: FecR domain-containing protein [Proteobacteria bacterium]|nr:FecR domain-containing protein [Pseudomonadota bacterium]HQR04852.1 FecR domain-containing protein [Rhodocyclaceae bacterium]
MIRFLHTLLSARRYPTTAADWAARAQAGRMSGAEQRALDAWLKADPDNVEAYARCNRVGHLAALMRQRADRVMALPAYRRLLEKEERRRTAWRPLVLGGAALAAGGAALMLGLWLHTPVADLTITTARGEQRQLPLEDGSRVHVNTDSTLSVAFSARERRVDLRRGEAYFEVQRDPGRPFVVRAGSSEVRVVGTRFSVHRDGERLEVIVTEGRVKVIPDLGHKVVTLPGTVDLQPGDDLRLDLERDRLQVSRVNAEQVTAWRTGFIHFDNAPLEDVIADVNRYTRQEFVIVDAQLRTLRLSGNFKIGDSAAVEFVLRDGFGIETEAQGDRLLLHRRPAG